jgi:hypothetical protein
MGPAELFLGMEITRDRSNGTVMLSQHRMTGELLSKYGLTDANPRTVPMNPSLKLHAATDTSTLYAGPPSYSELVGSLLYLSVCTRPDISYAVGALARYMSKPTVEHGTAAKAVLRYLAGTARLGITYGPASPIIGYCDADFAGNTDTRRSTTGYVFILNSGVISWSSRLQPTVAASTAEAEYMAAAHATKEALWLRKLLQSFGITVNALPMLCDNQAALKLIKHPIASLRSKHIDVMHHLARERVARGETAFTYCHTSNMIADCMTKPLPEFKLKACRSVMGMRD